MYIFDEYLDGSSIIGIQKKLKENEIPSPRGNATWSKRSIEQILENEKYIGSVIARKTITFSDKGHKRIQNETEPKYLARDIFPAIVTKEIFKKAQDEHRKRSNIIKDDTGTHRKNTHYSSKSGQMNK